MRRVRWFILLLVGLGLVGGATWLASRESARPGERDAPGGVTETKLSPAAAPGQITDQPIPEETVIEPVGDGGEPRGDGVVGQDDPDGGDAAEPRADPGAPGLAVPRFAVTGDAARGDAAVGESLASLMLSAINTPRYERCVRTRLRDILQEAKLQESDLVDRTWVVVQRGGLRGVRYLVLGELIRLPRGYHVKADLADCRTGQVVSSAWVAATSVDDAAARIPELASLLGLRDEAVAADGADGRSGAVRLAPLAGTMNASDALSITLRTSGNRRLYREGETISFALQANEDCHVTLLAIDSRGEMTMLLPNRWERNTQLRGGVATTVPGEGAAYRFPILPPPGPTRVKVLATRRPHRLSGVTPKSLQDEAFVSLSAKTLLEAAGGSGDVNGVQVATAELTVIVEGEGEAETAARRAGGGGKVHYYGRPLDLDRDADANARVLSAWRQLMGAHLPRGGGSLTSVNSGQAKAHGWVVARERQGGVAWEVVSMGAGDAKAQLAKLRGEAGVRGVVPNYAVYAMDAGGPRTRLGVVQWGLRNTFTEGCDVGGPARLSEAQVRRLPLIGLVDGAIDVDEPRLRAALWVNAKETAGNGKDDDGNGWVDDVHGVNVLTRSGALCSPADRFQHGSFVASIIAGQFTEDAGDVCGALPQGRIVTAVALRSGSRPGEGVSGELADVLRGIDYVVRRGAKIVNLSLGVPVTKAQLAELNELPIWDDLERRGVLLVCAAGNDAEDNDRRPVFPASLPRANVLSVMAVDAAGQPGRTMGVYSGNWPVYSNHGARSVDVAAPGTLILGIPRRGDVSVRSGTSYAAAYATAAAAAAWARLDDPTPRRVIRQLMGEAHRLPALRGQCAAGGLVRMNSSRD